MYTHCPMRLTCETSSPGVEIQWFKNGRPLHIEGQYHMIQRGTVCELINTNASFSDTAEFSCLIVQSGMKTTANVTVRGKICLLIVLVLYQVFISYNGLCVHFDNCLFQNVDSSFIFKICFILPYDEI